MAHKHTHNNKSLVIVLANGITGPTLVKSRVLLPIESETHLSRNSSLHADKIMSAGIMEYDNKSTTLAAIEADIHRLKKQRPSKKARQKIKLRLEKLLMMQAKHDQKQDQQDQRDQQNQQDQPDLQDQQDQQDQKDQQNQQDQQDQEDQRDQEDQQDHSGILASESGYETSGDHCKASLCSLPNSTPFSRYPSSPSSLVPEGSEENSELLEGKGKKQKTNTLTHTHVTYGL